MKPSSSPFTLRAAALAVLLLAVAVLASASAQPASATGPAQPVGPTWTSSSGVDQTGTGIQVGHSIKNDVSQPLRTYPPKPVRTQPLREGSRHPLLPNLHVDRPDPVVQRSVGPATMPSPILNFEGVPLNGYIPPDTNGEAGTTQYVQIVNVQFEVFNKSTGASIYGPVNIETIWTGFGGYCEFSGAGDPVVLYDQLAGRWLVSQFAGTSVITDECIAVSTSSDATGSYNRYDFYLGSNFFDYPKLAVWPDAYYLGENVFDSSGLNYLGPQPFAFDRAAMLSGGGATWISPGLQSSSLGFMLPGDLDGSLSPPSGAPNPFLSAYGNSWSLFRFHVDFVNPGNTTFTLAGTLTPAGYTQLCPGNRNCVPQKGTGQLLDAIGDRPMFRSAYRIFPDSHEALVGNRTVSSGGVAGIRWWEINNVTSGTPGFTQQSTYQPDSTWRWMASAAMDQMGDLALGSSVSSSSIYPQVRYAGRLATDAVNTLAQGEAHLYDGSGSQTAWNRWGDYSDLTIDPSDDCTFWYTNEYYPVSDPYTWHTRIGNFKFPGCGLAPGPFGKGGPSNGATGQPLNPTISWQSNPYATSYEYCVNTSAGCGGSWTNVGSNTTAQLTGLSYNTTYYWQVRGRNNIGTTEADSGTWWSFTTAASPPPLPPNADYDSDRKRDLVVYRPSTGVWYVAKSSCSYTCSMAIQWGISTDIVVPGDYDGDGKTDIAVYRPGSGYWYILKSSCGYTCYSAYQWGTSGDIPVPGYYDGDGKTDVAVYRPSSGAWYILRSSCNYTCYLAYQWGNSTDKPMPGDYDGDGRTDIAFWRPSSGVWYILRSSCNYTCNVSYQWGNATDKPVTGDYDGDGKFDIGVFRPVGGMWYILKSSCGFGCYSAYQWGVSTDIPVPGDYDGDGRSDMGVFRPGTRMWYALKSSCGYTCYLGFQWGNSTDVPVPHY